MKLVKKSVEIIDALWKVDENNAAYRQTTPFKQWQDNAKDEVHNYRPPTSICQEKYLVCALIQEVWRVKAEISNTIDSSTTSAYTILSEKLSTVNILLKGCQNWHPHQLETRVGLSMEIFKQVRSRSWCTCSKNCNRRRTWLYQYDPENKAQSKQWLPRYGSVWLKERQTCQDQRSWQQFFCYVLFWMLKAFCLLIFLETKRIIPSAD